MSPLKIPLKSESIYAEFHSDFSCLKGAVYFLRSGACPHAPWKAESEHMRGGT